MKRKAEFEEAVEREVGLASPLAANGNAGPPVQSWPCPGKDKRAGSQEEGIATGQEDGPLPAHVRKGRLARPRPLMRSCRF